MTAEVQAIQAAVAAIAWGVQHSIDAFFSATATQGGRAYRVNQIADATSTATDGLVLAWAEGPGWCVLVQVGALTEVRL
jgi:putative exporter of polyketide antibiotics